MRILFSVGAPTFVQPKESSNLLAGASAAPPLEKLPQQSIVIVSGCPYCQVGLTLPLNSLLEEAKTSRAEHLSLDTEQPAVGESFYVKAIKVGHQKVAPTCVIIHYCITKGINNCNQSFLGRAITLQNTVASYSNESFSFK